MQTEIKSTIWAIFSYVEAISSLNVNLQKSILDAVGEVPHQEELADILSYNISSLPLIYLGLPLGAPFKSKSHLGQRS